MYLKGDKLPFAPAKPKPKEADRLPKDARVLIHGLTSAAGGQLNGLEGKTCGFHADSGRYDVRLEVDERIVSVKQANLIDLGTHKL